MKRRIIIPTTARLRRSATLLALAATLTLGTGLTIAAPASAQALTTPTIAITPTIAPSAEGTTALRGTTASRCVTVAPTGEPVVISGTGKTQTAPFDLAGGAYRVEWTFADLGRGYAGLELEPVVEAPGNRGELIVNGVGEQVRASGDSHLYGVKPGRYYLDVSAPNGWTVTLTPFAG